VRDQAAAITAGTGKSGCQEPFSWVAGSFLGRPRGRMVNSKRESSDRAFIPRLPTGRRPAALAADRARLHAARPQLSRLIAQHPEGLSSQRQALKVLAAIVQTDKRDPDAASSAARSQSAVAGPTARGQSAVASSAARGASAGRKRRRTGPVWRASGPFVREAPRRG